MSVALFFLFKKWMRSVKINQKVNILAIFFYFIKHVRNCIYFFSFPYYNVKYYVGGTLVYSTCTLSPVQNEGVVNMALKSLAEETTLQFVVNDLTQAVKPLGFMGRFYGKFQGVALGNLLVPHLSNNFGPTYFCRITRKT